MIEIQQKKEDPDRYMNLLISKMNKVFDKYNVSIKDKNLLMLLMIKIVEESQSKDSVYKI